MRGGLGAPYGGYLRTAGRAGRGVQILTLSPSSGPYAAFVSYSHVRSVEAARAPGKLRAPFTFNELEFDDEEREINTD